MPVVEVTHIGELVTHHRSSPGLHDVARGFEPDDAAVQRRYYDRAAPPLRNSQLRGVDDARLDRVACPGEQLLEAQPLL